MVNTNPQAQEAKDKNDGQTEAVVDKKTQEASYRAIAVQHALSIEEKKKLQTRVLDTIIVAFDLPNDQATTSANPTPADANCFRDCLFLFRPEDLDEVVSERNIDDRCGYALCRDESRQSKAVRRWDARLGKMVEGKTGSWCSTICKDRTSFVRQQLSAEPAWLRHGQKNHIRLQTDLEEVIDESTSNDTRQDDLAMERGDSEHHRPDDFSIVEKQPTKVPKPPKMNPQITVGDLLEGLPIHTIGARKDQL